MVSIVLVFLISVAASAIQTVVGFGYIIFAMALFPLFLPIDQCLVIAQAGGLFLSLSLLWGKFKQIDFRYILFPSLFASIGAIAGLLSLRSMSGSVYMKILGVILILLALWMWKFASKIKIRPTAVNGMIVGTIGGIMGALFGISAPAFVLYFCSNMENKDSYMVPLQATLSIQTAICLAGRAALGMWPAQGTYLLVPAFVGILLGGIPGRRMYSRLNPSRLKLVIYAFVAVFGIYTLLSN